MTSTACYIIVAIVLAPALITAGLNPMAVHLFVLYWGMLSFITPPVAIPAYAAAAIGGGDPLKTSIEATKLGFVLYLVPFFFVYSPELVFEGVTLTGMTMALVTSFVGITYISAGYSGYLIGVGVMRGGRALGWLQRGAMVIGGVLLAWPAGVLLDGVALALLAPVTVACLIMNRRAAAKAAAAAS